MPLIRDPLGMQSSHPVASQSAASLLLASTTIHRFSTQCRSLDQLLTPPIAAAATSALAPVSSEGLAAGAILELLGPPGIGKTRTCLAMMLSARFEAIESGNGDQVLVVDAEGSLSPQMIYEAAVAYARHHSHEPSTARQVCDGIHYKRIYEASLLVAFFHALPSWLERHPQVKLIVIDTLSCHLRPTSLDQSTRNMILALIKLTLTLATSVYSVSFVITTQLTIKLFEPDGSSSGFTRTAEALLVPQLGESWIGGQCWRVVLYFDYDGERLAHLLDAHLPSRATKAGFTMDALGPCDIAEGVESDGQGVD